MGRKRPDVVRWPPSPLQGVTAADMARQGWQVRASCPVCGVSLHVDVGALAKVMPAGFILWGVRPRCRSWIEWGDGRCRGRVRLTARSIQGGTWTDVSAAEHRRAAEATRDALKAMQAPEPADLEHPGGDPMCNNYRLAVPANAIGDVFRDLERPLRFEGGSVPNLEPREDIKIGQTAPIVVMDEEGPLLTQTRWAWKGPGGRPVFNFRSDGRSFAGSRRCLIPADGFYEFTAAQPGHSRKTKWLFQDAERPWFWIAGVVRDDAFAMLTTEPGDQVRPFHDRQVVVLPLGAALDWLDLQKPEAQLLTADAGVRLAVTQVYPPPL